MRLPTRQDGVENRGKIYLDNLIFFLPCHAMFGIRHGIAT